MSGSTSGSGMSSPSTLIFPSIRDFPMSQLFVSVDQNTGVSASASVLPTSSGLISLRIFWSGLLAIQGILGSLLQHCSSKASIRWGSTFIMVFLSQSYVATGKTTALTIWTSVGRAMSLLFNTLSRVCHSFPAKEQSSDFMAAVTIRSDFRAQEEEVCHCSLLFLFYLP